MRALLHFFYIFPLLLHVKKFIKYAVFFSKILPPANYEIFFTNTISSRFNAADFLDFAAGLIGKKKYSVRRIFHKIITMLLRYHRRIGWRGFKFLMAGRFTRRDRATYL
jgi:hypothetical protein